MKANRVMTRDVVCIAPETRLPRAWSILQKLRVRHLPVTQGGLLCGLLSDRDFLLRAQLKADRTLELPDVAAAEVMTLSPLSCPPGAPVSRIASLMLAHRIDSIPIVGLGGQLVGLITSADLLELLTEPDSVADEVPFAFQIRHAA
ncbi:MAG: CBS domain-containing protein [Myxococcaceae bacterium]